MMTKLVFVEGVSGVGKSTMSLNLAEDLAKRGYRVKVFAEFDYRNPIDFYSTAYFSLDEYERFCSKYSSYVEGIRDNTVRGEDIRLVRYYDGNTPLFEEPLLSELKEKEFCYKPTRLVSLEEYTSVYRKVWENFALAIDDVNDFIIFDGSLLHHPINDMMRNYCIAGEQAVSHVMALLSALGDRKRHIFYLKVQDISTQLKTAHKNRNQEIPTEKEMEFWKTRYQNDRIVLDNIREKYYIYDVSHVGWDLARKMIEGVLTVV